MRSRDGPLASFDPKPEVFRVIEEGKPAPDFQLKSDTGDTGELSDLRGRPVVLYFYPKDDSPTRFYSN
jgi:cytochrome oxidase Cu insertion factor (SCO1/SenC/PrrC family)